MLISEFLFVGWVFCSLVFVSFLHFLESLIVVCMVVHFLACSAAVFPGNVCLCWRLGSWDEFGEGRLEEKVFVIHCGWGPRGKGEHSRFSATGLMMRWGDPRSRRRGVKLSAVYLLPCDDVLLG